MYEKEERTNGQVFSDVEGNSLKSDFCDRRFIKFVERARREQPNLIDQDVNMFEMIEVSRSLKRTSNTKTRQEGLNDAIIDKWNRRRKTERSRSGELQLEMRKGGMKAFISW